MPGMSGYPTSQTPPNRLGDPVPIPVSRTIKGRGRPAKYPWASWCKPVHDHAFLLIRGKDYTCTTLSLIQQFRRKAEEFGVTPNWEYPTDVTLNEADQVLIWATPEQDEDEPTPYEPPRPAPQPAPDPSPEPPPVTVLVDNPWELLPTKPFSR